MIPAKEFEGELWIKASDHHQAIKAALAQPAQELVKYKCTVIDDQHPQGIPLEQWGNTGKAQPAQERNFCPRCGKRTPDLTTIHTCTPPQENV